MIVVGGTYSEHVVVPSYEELAGSGVRAAAALGDTRDVTLYTAIDAATTDLAQAVLGARGLAYQAVQRSECVGFEYFTPVSPPSVNGPSASYADVLSASDDAALVFGTIENGPRDIRAERMVIDPQRPRDLGDMDLVGLQFDSLSVVANAREIRALAKTSQSLDEAARRVLRMYGAAAVVVKNSAQGCLVATQNDERVDRVGSCPTRSVWPIGSGDVFAAAYAHAWTNGADPVEAARVASGSAAWWCATRSARVPVSILEGRPASEAHPDISSELATADSYPLVYLAAPFFTLSERWLVELCRDVLWGLGARVFSPLHDVGPGGDEVAARDLAGLDEADSVLALLDGWDSGTVYEVGWAHHKGLPVVGFLNSPDHEGTKMLVGTGAEIHRDLSSALYRVVWAGMGQPLYPARVDAT